MRGGEGTANPDLDRPAMSTTLDRDDITFMVDNYLARLDAFARAGEGQSDLFSAQAPTAEDAEVARARALAERVASLDPDALSPREALDALYELRRLASAD